MALTPRPHGGAAVFLDKDGTLIRDLPYRADPDAMELLPGAAPGLRLLARAGFSLFVVSNQSGVARGCFPEEALAGVEAKLEELFRRAGVTLAGFYYCPHHPEGVVARFGRPCACRKPAPGLLLRAGKEHRLDLPASWMVGDILDDVAAGRAAGCRTVLIDNGNETEWHLTPERVPDALAPNLMHAAGTILDATFPATLGAAS